MSFNFEQALVAQLGGPIKQSTLWAAVISGTFHLSPVHDVGLILNCLFTFMNHSLYATESSLRPIKTMLSNTYLCTYKNVIKF
jgi:hypothetical protein